MQPDKLSKFYSQLTIDIIILYFQQQLFRMTEQDLFQLLALQRVRVLATYGKLLTHGVLPRRFQNSAIGSD
jgi:hypothetical protein